MWSAGFLTLALGFFIFGIAWLEHEYRDDVVHQIPRLENEIPDIQKDIKKLRSDIMPSCIKGQKTK